MNLMISFSGRKNGNCDDILNFIATDEDTKIYFRDLNVHECGDCMYECFKSSCKYHDDIYSLYKSLKMYNKIFLVVPMYCGNPSSLYFKFNERSQEYFMHNEEDYESIISKLYIIGVYGDRNKNKSFIPCFEQWFENTPYQNRVLGIERHQYGQKIEDKILCVQEVKDKILDFIRR